MDPNSRYKSTCNNSVLVLKIESVRVSNYSFFMFSTRRNSMRNLPTSWQTCIQLHHEIQFKKSIPTLVEVQLYKTHYKKENQDGDILTKMGPIREC